MNISNKCPGYIMTKRKMRTKARYLRSVEKLKARGVVNSEGLLDITGSVDITDFSYDGKIKSLADVGIRLGTVTGDFHLRIDVESLEGCPRVCKSFYCHSDKLRSLKGGPEEVRLDYRCMHYYGKGVLESLEGMPLRVGRDFDCTGHPKLAGTSKPSCVAGEFKCDIVKIERQDKYLNEFIYEDELCYCGA